MIQLEADRRKQRIAELEDHFARKADGNGGQLKRYEVWRREYLDYPYLTKAKKTLLGERNAQLISNMLEITQSGLFAIGPALLNNAWLMQRYTHLLCELDLRQWDLPRPDEESKRQMESYHALGEPLGVKLFRNFQKPTGFFLIKLGNKRHLQDTLISGRVKLSPASTYLEKGLSKAATDNERKREFILPTFDADHGGIRVIEFEGQEHAVSDNDIMISRECPNYYLYSVCTDIDYRLPTDFGRDSENPYDAALVIHNPKKLIRNMLLAFFARHKGFSASHDFVSYYDPYLGPKNFQLLEMTKHFSYLYQKEYRIIFRQNRVGNINLEPIFLDVGSLEEDATLLTI